MKQVNNIALILGVLVMSFAVGYLAVAWTEPGQTPPLGNVPAPLNVGTDSQAKEGGLVIGTNSTAVPNYGLIVRYGNVGIGTTSPGAPLHISASTPAIRFTHPTGPHTADILRSTASDSYGQRILIEGGGPLIIGSGEAASAINTNVAVSSESLWLGSDITGTTEAIRFVTSLQNGWTGRVDAISIRGDGNVGIGTTSPAEKLHVDGRTRATGFCIGTDCVTTWTEVGMPSGSSGETLRHDGTNWMANNLLFHDIGNARIGIGTVLPSYKLDVAGTGRFTGALTLDTQASSAGHAVRADRTITAGNGLTGGGNLTADRTLAVGAGTGISVGATTVDLAYPTKSCPSGYAIRVFDLGSATEPTCVEVGVGTVTGSGTTDYIPRWTGSTSLGDSVIRQSGSSIGIGISPSYTLDVSGNTRISTYLGVGGAPSTSYRIYAYSGAAYGIRADGSTMGGYFRDSDGTSVTYVAYSNYGIYQATGTRNYFSGNVGIGTTSPGYKLDVASAGSTTARFGTASTDEVIIGGGAGKLTVGTIDPIFEIDGKKYATYVADFAGGTRIETSGTLEFTVDNPHPKIVIDFDNLKEGTDLWLFWQASNKDINDIAVLLTTSFDGKVWYQKNRNILTIYGEGAGEISYRLSAPRVDHQDWSNIVEDQSLEGIKVADY